MRLAQALPAFLLGALACAPGAHAALAEEPWPPQDPSAPLYVHLGEERWDHPDGRAILARAIADSARYRPAMVTLSGDKAGNGTAGNLGAWRTFMEPYDTAGIPWFPAIGNTDRASPLGIPPGFQGLGPIPAGLSSLQPYRDGFADRPYPFGDGRPYRDPRFGQRARPASDPAGASTHYFVDHGAVRWIFLDNSCWSISRCDAVQSPPLPDSEGNRSQFDWLERRATEASRAGRTVLVAMHMPTRDPRDQSQSDPEALAYVMGKSETFGDNPRFEDVAERSGVDGVFVAHIRAQLVYRGRGRVPYFVDGGAGGRLHTAGPVGTDHGYWHGYRLVWPSRGRLFTDAVPILVADGITLVGAGEVRRGALERYAAFGRQPVLNDRHKVQMLELRDPRPAPTSTPAAALPPPARMFTSSNPFVLGPKAPAIDDPRRDPETQTKNGVFRARCPGRARVRVTSGWETAFKDVRVPSRPGPVARSVRVTSRRVLPLRLRPRLAHRVARVRLAQPAEVLVRVRRRGRTVRTLKHACASAGSLTVVWDGRTARRGRLVPGGTYQIEAKVRSDRPTIRRRSIVRVTR